MATAASPEQRRRFARLSAHEAAVSDPTLLVQVKRLVAGVDTLPRVDQLELAAELSQDWGRLFYGCVADRNRGRYSIYRRSSAQIQALHDELDAALPRARVAFAAGPSTAAVTVEVNPEE